MAHLCLVRPIKLMPPEETVASSSTVAPGRFRLEKLAVRRAIFEEVPRQLGEPGDEPPQQRVVKLEITAQIEMNADALKAIVSLDVTVTPDPKWQPYRIRVTISGEFAGENVTLEVFEQFCRVAVPPILFPYVRQLVHSMTTDGAYGVVRVDPVNLIELLARSTWGSATSASTEPSQP